MISLKEPLSKIKLYQKKKQKTHKITHFLRSSGPVSCSKCHFPVRQVMNNIVILKVYLFKSIQEAIPQSWIKHYCKKLVLYWWYLLLINNDNNQNRCEIVISHLRFPPHALFLHQLHSLSLPFSIPLTQSNRNSTLMTTLHAWKLLEAQPYTLCFPCWLIH